MTLFAEIAILLIGGLLLVRFLSGVPRAAGRSPMHGRRPPSTVRAPLDLVRITDIVIAGGSSASDVHRRVRPLMREIAAGRLAARGISLDRDPVAAQARLGDELWELVRLHRPPPADPRGPGLDLATFTALADRLAAL